MVKPVRQLKCRHSGFSLLELVVSIFIISLLAVFAYTKLETLAEDVERVSFEGARNNIQAQITLKVAYWYAEQYQVSPAELKQSNPMDLIQHKPSNYGGEVNYSDLLSAPEERWYFVSDKRWLVYKAKRVGQLLNEFDKVDIIPFQIETRLNHPQQVKGVAIEAKLEPRYKFYWKADNTD
jgi:prepilin-type N-terminal cleavage/methylation domain-containing protein